MSAGYCAKYMYVTLSMCLKKFAPRQSWRVCLMIQRQNSRFFGVRYSALKDKKLIKSKRK